MLAIISILLTNLESLNKTEIKQMAVCIVNKNKEKKKTYPSSTINSFQKINVEILTGSKKKKIAYLSDLALALKGHSWNFYKFPNPISYMGSNVLKINRTEMCSIHDSS